MTISSSLNAGVAGLNANANRLATIADNIANSSTYGYRRAVADFQQVVNRGSVSTSYTAGGVRATNTRLIDNGGSLIGTSNATDIAIDGRGFFAVTEISAVGQTGGAYPISLATTGSYRADANGVMRTSTGQVLMGWPADANGVVGANPRDSMAALVPVVINPNQYFSNPTTTMRLGVNLPATATMAGAAGASSDLTVEYFGNLSTSESLGFTFAPVVPTTGASNQWQLTITDTASGGAVVGEYTLNFDASQASGGTLASITTVSGAAYDPLTGLIDVATAGGVIALDVGLPGAANGMSQLSDSFAPVAISKNGSPVANLVSVEVDANGYLQAIYDQGFNRALYQLPVVDVPNPNGLITLSNQTYQLSPASGAFYLWNAGEGPTGRLVGYSRQESSTDVAAELTQLIQTQRAYSSNAKVIQTVDEMLQETTNIKR